ncbi:unannotated protein [freshwater metagenome]|uniref:Unannotated protein n=1 Tax=freshwater metagenome TaxID=449393 RepID=A0A6J7SDD8_9ZZZZ
MAAQTKAVTHSQIMNCEARSAEITKSASPLYAIENRALLAGDSRTIGKRPT